MPFISSLAPSAGRYKQNREGAEQDMTQDTVIFPQCGKCDGSAIRDLDGLPLHEFSIKISSGPFALQVPDFMNFQRGMAQIAFSHVLQTFHNYIDKRRNLFK